MSYGLSIRRTLYSRLRSVNRQRTTFPTRQGGFALDRLDKATSARNRKKDQIVPVLLSSVSILGRKNNRIPVGSQSSSEQAAIGIDRKALAPPPRIAGRASGVLTVGDLPLRSGIKSGSSCSPDCFSFGCSRPNFLTKVSSCRRILTAGRLRFCVREATGVSRPFSSLRPRLYYAKAWSSVRVAISQ